MVKDLPDRLQLFCWLETKLRVWTWPNRVLIKQLRGRPETSCFWTRPRVSTCIWSQTPSYPSIPKLNVWCCSSATGPFHKGSWNHGGFFVQTFTLNRHSHNDGKEHAYFPQAHFQKALLSKSSLLIIRNGTSSSWMLHAELGSSPYPWYRQLVEGSGDDHNICVWDGA